jgi:hypothetical protein
VAYVVIHRTAICRVGFGVAFVKALGEEGVGFGVVALRVGQHLYHRLIRWSEGWKKYALLVSYKQLYFSELPGALACVTLYVS